jgi:hypothetical protein
VPTIAASPRCAHSLLEVVTLRLRLGIGTTCIRLDDKGILLDNTQLLQRHLAVCDSTYLVAVSRGDIEVAAHLARSALSVALTAVVAVNKNELEEAVLTWYERLSSLYIKNIPAPRYVSQTLKWASDAILELNPEVPAQQELGTEN